MTALTAPRPADITRFERLLLDAAAGIDHFVETRLERRTGAAGTVAMQVAAGEARADAMALGSLGMLPR